MKKITIYNICKLYSILLLGSFFLRIPQSFGIQDEALPPLTIMLVLSEIYIFYYNRKHDIYDKFHKMNFVILIIMSVIILFYQIYLLFL